MSQHKHSWYNIDKPILDMDYRLWVNQRCRIDQWCGRTHVSSPMKYPIREFSPI